MRGTAGTRALHSCMVMTSCLRSSDHDHSDVYIHDEESLASPALPLASSKAKGVMASKDVVQNQAFYDGESDFAFIAAILCLTRTELELRKWFVILPALAFPASLVINAPFGRFATEKESILTVDGTSPASLLSSSALMAWR
jgi:hypothetical protein